MGEGEREYTVIGVVADISEKKPFTTDYCCRKRKIINLYIKNRIAIGKGKTEPKNMHHMLVPVVGRERNQKTDIKRLGFHRNTVSKCKPTEKPKTRQA